MTPTGATARRVRRETYEGRDWLCLEVSREDGSRGEAWAPYCEQLRAWLERCGDDASETPGLGRLGRGLIETARTDADCRRHGLPLHVWLGGAIREAIPITLPVSLAGCSRTERAARLHAECARLRSAADALGVRSFSLHEHSADVREIAETVATLREATGPVASLSLHLAGQLSESDARSLMSALRESDVMCLVDPCATVPLNVQATEGALPALGLSAWRYDRGALLRCMAAAPPAVLVVDPLHEEGPYGVRRLAGVARVLQVDVGLTAAGGAAWLSRLCATLSAVMPAIHRPVELPLGWTGEMLHQLEVRDGALKVAARCAPESRLSQQPTPGLDHEHGKV